MVEQGQAAEFVYYPKDDEADFDKRPSDNTHISNMNGDNEYIDESSPEAEYEEECVYDEDTPEPLFPSESYNIYIHQPMVNLVKNQTFQMAIIGLIIVNSALMGVATFESITSDDKVFKSFEIVDHIILSLFTAELGLNLFVYHRYFWNDPWRCFDFLTIAMSYLLSDFKIIRSFRIFRAFRLFGRIPALKKILSALFSTGDQMVSIFFVLSLFYYIFAVMFTQLFSDCEEICYEDGSNYFGTLHDTIMTLFILMNLEDWANLTRQTQSLHSWAWFPIIVFILVSSFIMLNLIIAVLCEALSQIKDEKEQAAASNDRMSLADPKLELLVSPEDIVGRHKEEMSNKNEYRKGSTEKLKKRIEGLRTKLHSVTGVKQQHHTVTVSNPSSQNYFDDMKAEIVPNWQTVSEFPVPGCCYTHKM